MVIFFVGYDICLYASISDVVSRLGELQVRDDVLCHEAI
jgi:hypothetical protein